MQHPKYHFDIGHLGGTDGPIWAFLSPLPLSRRHPVKLEIFAIRHCLNLFVSTQVLLP